MARVLGYGGIGNTNGARDFTSKTAAVTGRNPRKALMGVGFMLSLIGVR